MRHLWFVLLALVLAVVESTLPRVLHLEAVRPVLVVPLVLFFALRLNTIEGGLLSLAAGAAHEAAAGTPAGRGAFALIALFVVSRLVLAGLRAEGRAFESFFAGALTLGFHAVTFGLSRIFEKPVVPVADVPWLSVSLLSAGATMCAAPFVLSLARRIERSFARAAEMA